MSLTQETEESYDRPLDLRIDIKETDYDNLKEHEGSEIRNIAGAEAVDVYSGEGWNDSELTARAMELEDGSYILSVTEHKNDSSSEVEDLGPVYNILDGKPPKGFP